MNRQELNVLVRGVAQRFEKETGMSITARVLDALVIPALPHLETVTRELDEGKVTVRTLRTGHPPVAARAASHGPARLASARI